MNECIEYNSDKMKSNNLILLNNRSKNYKLFIASKTLFAISSVAIILVVMIVNYSIHNQSKSDTQPIKKNTDEYKLASILVPHSGEKYSCFENEKKSTSEAIKNLSEAISVYSDQYRFNNSLTDSERLKVLERMNSIEKDLNTFLSKTCPNFKDIPLSSAQITPLPTTYKDVVTTNPIPSITQKIQERVMVVLPPNEQKYSCLKGTETSIYKMRGLIDKSISENKIALDNMNKKIEDCNNKSLYTESILKCISDTTKIKDDFKKSSDINVANMEMDFRIILTEACI